MEQERTALAGAVLLVGVFAVTVWAAIHFELCLMGETSPCSASDSELSISTLKALHLTYLKKFYRAILNADSRITPRTWTVSAGRARSSNADQISGMPTQGDTYSLTVFVKDSSSTTVSRGFRLQVFELPLDQYGGLTNKACSNGPRAHFYTQKINSRWHLCTPAGNAFWMNGVYHVDAGDMGSDYQGVVLANVVNSKYASGFTTNSILNWSLQSVKRLQSWGFNTLAEYAVGWTLPVAVHSDWPTSDNTIPVKLPFVAFEAPSLYSFTNSGNYAPGPVKDIVYGIKPTVYTGYRSQSSDFWDPNFGQWLQNALVNDYWVHQAYTGPHSDYLIGFNIDDTDNLQGFGAGPDFPTTANGLVAAGYDQPHLGWLILVTAPSQTSNSHFGVTYTDTTVYSKREFINWLSARYNGSVSSLNSAWRSNYTTFGSNGGFGTGTGILDEDGTCPSKASGQSCWVPSDAFSLAGASSHMKQDLDDFLLHHAQQYFSVIKSAIQTAAPGVLYMGPTVLGTWGAPPRQQILQAAAQYVDVLTLGTIPPNCTNCTDVQQRIDFIAQYGGDKPWVNWEGYQAKTDSYMSPYANQGQTDQFQTQAARGQFYQQIMMPQLLNAQDTSTGTYHIVGLKWWELYDNRGGQANWGLLTRRDNPYDGVSATTLAGADSWGYPTGCVATFGCERALYGNFLDEVSSANLCALEKLVAH